MPQKTVNFYIDGYNLFYCKLKGTQYKWLDLEKLCHFYFPKYRIGKIKYFTARAKSRKSDPNIPVRQQMYLRALQTNPKIEIIFGTFLENKKMVPLITKINKNKRQKLWVLIFNYFRYNAPLADSKKGEYQYALSLKSEEKGSDVNLASHLICDAYDNKYDMAVVVSNDSDLSEPIKIVNNKLGKPAGLLSTVKKPNYKLVKVSRFQKRIREKALLNSQYPVQMSDRIGNFNKPPDWK